MAKSTDPRDPPLTTFSTMERLVIALVARNMCRREIAMRLHMKEHQVENATRRSADKIPGRGLTTRQKIMMWSRGCTRTQMMGEGWIPGHSR